MFERLDRHNKGVIGPDELQEVMRQDGLKTSKEDVLQFLQRMDIEGSGTLNYREFLAATMQVCQVGSICFGNRGKGVVGIESYCFFSCSECSYHSGFKTKTSWTICVVK